MKLVIGIWVLLFASIRLNAQQDSINSSILQELYNQALVKYQAEQFFPAIALLDSCIGSDSLFVQARFLKALSLQKVGNPERANTEFEIINRLYPHYLDVDKRIKSYYLTVYLSKYWYYMLAMLLLTVFIITLVAKTVADKKA